MRRFGLIAVTLAAFALRCHQLGAVTLRWDEGWSIALGRLSVAEMAQITRLDVHPPLYYLLLKPWLAVGSAPELWVRYLSVLAATLAVPLAAVAARAWWGPDRRAANLTATGAALAAALAPALLYYAGVTRMYTLAAAWLLLATWGLGRLAGRGDKRGAAAAVLGATAALYTFYYTGFALAGLFAAALLGWPRAWRRTVGAGLVVAALFLPWAAWIAPPLAARAAAAPAAGGALLPKVMGLLDDGLNGALFVADRSPWLSLAVLAIALGGTLVARPPRLARLGVAVLPVLLTLAGAAAGAGAHMFAPRYVLAATPFLALGVGRGLAGWWQRAPAAGLAAGVAMLALVAPLLGGYVYERNAEVTDPFDPAADWRALAPRTDAGDVVAFNILSLAGLYDRYRTPDDPPWTYAQLWDPVHEPLAAARERLYRAAAEHGRLWLVLYKGTYAPGSAAAKAWADATLFPLAGWWREDTLYQGYVASADQDFQAIVNADFGHGVRLESGSFPSTARPGRGLGVVLAWRAEGQPDANARVFVHAYGPDGTLVAQHDGFPVSDTRPQTTWQPGETIVDRHGLWLPPGTTGQLTLKVGLYDPATGARWPLSGGGDAVTLWTVDVRD